MGFPHNHSIQGAEVLTAIAASNKSITRQDPGVREKLLSLARQLTVALEKPSETIQRMGWAEPAAFAATRMAIDLKNFNELEKAGDASVGTSELAKATGADALLIVTLPVFTVAVLVYDMMHFSRSKSMDVGFHTVP